MVCHPPTTRGPRPRVGGMEGARPRAQWQDGGVIGYPARAVVDLDAIAGNVRILADRAHGAQVMGVVKADAYGHGLVPVARAALAGGATWLGVAQLAEALALRAAGITARAMTWLYAPGAPLVQAIGADLDLSVPAPWALEEVRTAARAAGKTPRVHLKVDTGMGRSGQLLEPWTSMLHDAMRAQAAGEVEVVGVWSHLARSDEVGHPSIDAQLAVLTEAVRRAERAGARLEVRHLANSAAVLAAPQTHLDLVRPGLAMYGMSPFEERDGSEFGLRAAMRLEADVAVVKNVPAGRPVSYGGHYVTPADTRLAVVPLGYADGVPRHASGAGPVMIAGQRHTVAGRVCMDQFVVDVGASSIVEEGHAAVLFGSGDDGEPSAEAWARAAGTICYEITTRLGARVPRVYVGSAGVEAAGQIGACAAANGPTAGSSPS